MPRPKLTPEQWIEAVKKQSDDLRAQLDLVNRRLKMDMGVRDKAARGRAYNSIARLARHYLSGMPEVPLAPVAPPEPRTENRSEGSAAIPFKVKGQKVFMGCLRFKCNDWIDVTRVFTDNVFDGFYQCPNGHSVLFGGVEIKAEKTDEVEVAPPVPTVGAVPEIIAVTEEEVEP